MGKALRAKNKAKNVRCKARISEAKINEGVVARVGQRGARQEPAQERAKIAQAGRPPTDRPRLEALRKTLSDARERKKAQERGYEERDRRPVRQQFGCQRCGRRRRVARDCE